MLLEITSARDRGQRYEFPDDQPVVLGRDADCEIRLNDDQCSRRHARIAPEQGALMLADLGSTNGVFLNGERCYREALATNDQIRVGGTILRVTGLAVRAAKSLSVRVHEHEPSVMASMHHAKADLLGGTAEPLPASEVAAENRILRQVCEITQTVAAGTDLPAILAQTLARMQEILKADTACILVQTADGEWTIRAAASGPTHAESITVSRTIVQEALQKGVAILARDPMNDTRFADSASIVQMHLASAICSPLKVNGAFVGVLFLDRRHHAQPFKPMDLRFAATVGNLIAMLMEKEQMQVAARQRERLATIGEVMAGLAHCVKNIIAALRFSVATLTRAVAQGKYESTGGYADNVLAQERRISDLVLDMLAYAKERTPVPEELDLKTVVEDVAAPFRGELEKESIQLHIATDPRCPRIWAEERALHRAFLNLFTNSLDAIRSRNDATTKEIRISIEPVGDESSVEIRFRDSGTGIPADKLGHIFEAFFSTKGSGGTGLGLSVTQKIIQEHGGTISVDSRQNEWTEFRITLPVGRKPPAESNTSQKDTAA